MDWVFSVDDIADDFWSPPPIGLAQPPEDGSASFFSSSPSASKVMNRSSSEWAFQRLIQEVSPSDSSFQSQQQPPPPPLHHQNDVVDIKDHDQDQSQLTTLKDGGKISSNTASFPGVRPSANIPIDSEEYQAVALSQASYIKPQDSAPILDNGSQASSTSKLGSQVPSKGSGYDSCKGQDEDSGALLRIPAWPSVQKKSGDQVWSTTSGSSREQSGDEEAEGEADAKRARRMLSNRESARRSRRRKQAHLTELETQVSQLKAENSTLMKRFSELSQQYNEVAVDNRVLKADVETLRAKLKMAEETVKRVTGTCCNHCLRYP